MSVSNFIKNKLPLTICWKVRADKKKKTFSQSFTYSSFETSNRQKTKKGNTNTNVNIYVSNICHIDELRWMMS